MADLTRDAGWEAALEGVDHVLHVASPLGLFAGADPDVMISAARDGTPRVQRAATAVGVKRVVMTSAANAASTPAKASPTRACGPTPTTPR
ncbi:hypothetical protein AB0O67_12820 [Streptomyces sp. NPDC086077]|uniref:hypothetical protein n=1 Tax=Streptomyces sp. NPDC086077 TaxID=3154862 RepID=UPI00343DED80